MNKTWTLEVQEKDGEFFIEFNDEILEGTGWKVGDDLIWTDNKDGSWTLTKSDKVWVKVDCIAQHRVSYMVQAPADHPEYALDTVTLEEAKEFSQEFLGETIFSHRVVSHDEALALCDKENDYLKSWTDEEKIQRLFTKEGEKSEY
jgi:hypothetical protein